MKESDGKKTLKSAFLYSISNIISIIVSLIAIPILTNLLKTDEMGMAVSFNTLKTLLSYIVLLAFYSTIDRAILDFKDKTKEYLSTIYIFNLLTVIFFYIIYLLFQNKLNILLGFDTSLISLMFIVIICQNGFNLMTTYWNFKNEYVKNFIANVLASPMAQILSIVFVYFLNENKFLGRIVGIELFSSLLGLFLGINIIRKTKFTFKTKYLKYALKLSLPIIPHLLSQTILSQSDILMIKHYVGNASAGIYSLAFSISTILYTVIIQFMRPWSSWVYRKINTDEINIIKKQSKKVLSFGFILTIGLLMINKEMIELFLNKDYVGAKYVIPPITLGVFLQFIYMFYYDINYYYKNLKSVMYDSILVAIINIILNAIFIKQFGYIAAGYTTLFSYLLLAILNYHSSKKVIKKSIYDNKQFLKLIILALFYMIIGLIFIDNIVIKYSTGCIIIISTILKNKKEIKEIIEILFKKKG